MSPRRSGPARAGVDRVVVAVAALAALALSLRVVGLGARPFHWDEARVGFWTLRFLESGQFEYRPVAGGPFLYVVGRWTMGLLGTSDAVARLPVAVCGGLLPLSALLFRGRLRDDETVLFAAVLAANPLLVYYSRFLRGDVVAAGAGLVAVGAAVRLWDGDRRFAPLSGAAVAVALAASGFAVAYPFVWLLAAFLVFDHERLLGRPERAASVLATVREGVLSNASTAARALAAGALTFLFFFAPRGGGTVGEGAAGLWRPGTALAVLRAAFVGSAEKFVGVRVLGRRGEGTHQLLPYLADAAGDLSVGALALVALAGVALLRDRYGEGAPRPLVAFAGYWGLAGLFAFPLVAEVSAPWVVVHAVVPLALPAAVGAAALVRFGARAFDRRETRDVAAACLLAVAILTQTGAVTAGAVYGPSTPENGLATYAQPADDLDPFAANVSAVAERDGGLDVLYYGDRFHAPGFEDRRPPVVDEWGNRLPLSWYVARAGADVDSGERLDALENPPPVVIASADRRATVGARLEGYAASEYRLALWNRRVVVFVRR